MATLAKLLGVLSLLAGAGIGLFGAAYFLATDTSESDVAAGLVILITGGMVGMALTLMTLGAAAYVIGEEAEVAQAARRRKWARTQGDTPHQRLAAERPYG